MNRHAVLLFAFLVAAYTSTQSLNKDALIFYQGAMRVAAGQIPFRDFSLPQGPVAPLVGGVFFTLFPPAVAWALLSGLLNAAMAALAFFAVTQLTQNLFAATVAGLATALAFLPPFGSFYNDHLAYLFVVAAFCVFQFSPGTKRPWLIGLLLALAFHTKQTVGVAGMAAYFMSVALGGDSERLKAAGRPLVWTFIWGIAGLLLIGVTGGGASYWWDAVWLPFTYAQNSPDKSGWRLLTFLIFPWDIMPSDLLADFPHHWGRWILFPFQLLFWFWLWRWPTTSQKKGAVIFFCLSTLWGGALLGRAASHLFLGTGVVLGLVIDELNEEFSFRVARISAALLLGFCAVQLGQSSWTRRHDSPLAARQLGREFRALPSKNLYALGETALLVASFAGLSPRQTNLYDDMGVSVPSTYGGLFRWQTRFREKLETQPPDWILQDKGWLAYPALGTRLARHLDENFAEVCQIGSLKLLRRRKIVAEWFPPSCQKPSPVSVSSLP